MKNLTIKFGDYVRTYDGHIARCERYYPTDDWWHFDSTVISDEYDYNIINKKELNKYVKKIREKIIDLIEEGDFVNGEKVIALKGDPYVKTVEDENDVVYTDFDREYGEWLGYEEIEIESIVTKEQFESMEYKIER